MEPRINDVLGELNGMKSQILDAIKRHCSQKGSHSEEHEQLASATEADLGIRAFCKQGHTNFTYLCTIKDCDFILSVRVPSAAAVHYGRNNVAERSAYQRRLFEKKVPVAELISDKLTLPNSRVNCEISRFVHGYQVPMSQDLTQQELHSLARAVAAMHIAAENWAPEGHTKPFAVRAMNVPSGFIHSDLNRENVIYGPGTSNVQAIIDFDAAAYNTLAYDLGQLLRVNFIKITFHPESQHKIALAFNNSAASIFLDEYSRHRPLQQAEIPIIRDAVVSTLRREIQFINQSSGCLVDEATIEAELPRIQQAFLTQFSYVLARGTHQLTLQE